MQKYPGVPSSFFVEGSAGALVSRFVNDVETVEALFAPGVIGMVSDVFSVVGIVSVGSAVAIVAYVNRAFELLDSIGKEIQSIQQSIAGVGRINEFLA